MMLRRGISDAQITEHGGKFEDGFFICDDSKFRAMLRDAHPVLRAKPFGLGDAVASVAQPIAGALDRVLGTNIKGCGGCAQRRETLNAIIPDLRALTERKTDV